VLHHLRVRNLGLLREAAIDPSTALTVITGETGAGKTLLLGGLRLILGDRADPSMVGPWGDRVEVEALLEGEEEIAVTRVVPREGRSRARLDDALITVGALAARLEGLVEIVGQHSHLRLRSQGHLLHLIDGALDDGGVAALRDYGEAWADLEAALDRQTALGGDEAALHRELDLVRHQVEEITGAGLKPGEDDDLEAEAQRLGNAEAIAELLAESLRLLDELSENCGEVVARLRRVAQLDPASGSLPARSEELAALVSELTAELRTQADALEADPRRAREVEERLTLLGDLKRKYGRTLAEVVEFGERSRTRLVELEELLAAASGIEEAVRKSAERVETTASSLTNSRNAAANRILESARGHLADLGMGGAVLEIDLQPRSPGPRGADHALLLFSSDPRLEPGPVASVASGGELSRLSLAFGLATRSAATPTVVFDEVDAGIGGVTALAMGRKLASLAEQTQVLCVTHLPQIAAHADRHYVVRSTGEAAIVEEVVGEERLTEISRMLAGLPDSQPGQEAAAELIAAARSGG